MANRGPSIFSVTRSKRRLIIVFALVRRGRRRLVGPTGQRRELRRLVAGLAGLGGRLRRLVDALAEQGIGEHPARSRGGPGRSETPLSQHDRDGELAVF